MPHSIDDVARGKNHARRLLQLELDETQVLWQEHSNVLTARRVRLQERAGNSSLVVGTQLRHAAWVRRGQLHAGQHSLLSHGAAAFRAATLFNAADDSSPCSAA